MDSQPDKDRMDPGDDPAACRPREFPVGQGAGPGPGRGPSRREAADEVLLEALAAGVSYESAGALAGVSGRTARRRMADVGFAAEVARRRSERVEMVSGRLAGLCERALQVLAQCLDAERPGDQLRAAELVLAMTRRFRADTDVHARLAALEASDSDDAGEVADRG